VNTKIFKTDEKKAKEYYENVLKLEKIRKKSEILESYRDEFSRDRDRILYSTAFRRLSGKTQVFIAGFDAHVRTRLTHTLEVNQIARTIAKSLELNETLCEAISFGHDIGHTPFGHVGEHILNCIMNNCFDEKEYGIKLENNQKGFKHNFQSIRILNELELNKYGNSGLNLTFFTLFGILHHTDDFSKTCEKFIPEKKCSIKSIKDTCEKKGNLSLEFYDDYKNSYEIKNAWSLEAYIVKWADEIAQRHHDIEDALIAGIIEPKEINIKLKKISEIRTTYNKYFQSIKNEIKKDKNTFIICSNYSKIIVDAYVSKFIIKVKEILTSLSRKYNINDETDFWKKRDEIFNDADFDEIKSYNKYFKENKYLSDYLENKIIRSEDVQIMNSKGIFILTNLFKRYLRDPLTLPDNAMRVST
jgi:dGTPase